MDRTEVSQDYKNAYVKGFSQAVKLFEYLSSKGVQQEAILQHLQAMLENDIRAWQQKEKITA